MLVDINFIEQRKKNNAPVLMVIVLTLLLAVSGYLLYWQLTSIKTDLESVQSELDVNLDKQIEISNLKTLYEQRLTLANQIEQIEASVFPSVPLLDQMLALLPNNSTLASYSFSTADGLTIGVRLESIEQIAVYSNRLEKESYIKSVVLSNISGGSGEDANYSVSLNIEVDRQAWIGVVANNEN